MSKDGALQYFSQKTGVIIWLVGVVGLGMVYVGYAGERRSVIFMIVGIVLVILCAYEVIRGKRRKKSGANLDAMADAEIAGRNLLGCALKELCLDASDVQGHEKIPLSGYSIFPVRTRPYFRRDEADGKLRSSNYQSSLFIFCPDRFYSYTYVASLVDKENAESGRMWRYDQVAEAKIAHEDHSYLVGTSEDKRESAPVEYLSLTDVEGRRFAFAYDRTEAGADQAVRVLALLKERAGIVPAVRSESPENAAPASAPPKTSSAARGRDLGIGVIGAEIQAPGR